MLQTHKKDEAITHSVLSCTGRPRVGSSLRGNGRLETASGRHRLVQQAGFFRLVGRRAARDGPTRRVFPLVGAVGSSSRLNKTVFSACWGGGQRKSAQQAGFFRLLGRRATQVGSTRRFFPLVGAVGGAGRPDKTGFSACWDGGRRKSAQQDGFFRLLGRRAARDGPTSGAVRGIPDRSRARASGALLAPPSPRASPSGRRRAGRSRTPLPAPERRRARASG